jgi:type VI secretion system secreted protein VgrG
VADYTQQNRLMKLDTPLGEDVLLLQELTGFEGISRLFSFDLNLLAYENDSIDFQQIVGKQVTVTLNLPDLTPRYINGYVSRFTQGGTDDRLFTHYHAEVVPWLWFLTRQADCRVFQGFTVPDILMNVFDDMGFSGAVKTTLTNSYPRLDYCVQYRETSFNFVSRLMEEFGIFYYFEHSDGQHLLVLADNSKVLPTSLNSSVSYDLQVGGLSDPEVINNWHFGQEVRTGKYTVTDYNFITPSSSLKTSEVTIISTNEGELFDYPALYVSRPGAAESTQTSASDGPTMDDSSRIDKLRMEEEEAACKVISGSGNCRGLVPGYAFQLENHPRKAYNTKYVVTEVRHFASLAQTYTSAGMTEGDNYSNTLTCIPADTSYRPPRITPKPFIQGPQPAIVVGPSGEEIWVDLYGRVKVQFYWDRVGTNDEKSSCWVRVSQPWAGNGWGSIWTPRIGQEVLVSFMEGDPDRPVITGRVYNANEMPPYKLPDRQTVSTFRSRSSKGGGGYNELRFEDLKNSEQVYIHAQKDEDVWVNNDSKEYIGNDRHLIVVNNQYEKVQVDKHLHIVGNHNEKIDGNMSLKITGNQSESVTGNKSLSVTGDQKESVTGTISVSATMGKIESISMGYAMTAMTIHLTAQAGMVIECDAGITLKSGSNSVDISPAGVFVTGTPFVFLNSGSMPSMSTDPSKGNPDSPSDATDPKQADKGQDLTT